MSDRWWAGSSLLEPSDEESEQVPRYTVAATTTPHFVSHANNSSVSATIDLFFEPMGAFITETDMLMQGDYDGQQDDWYKTVDAFAFEPEHTSYEEVPAVDYGLQAYALREQLRSTQNFKQARTGPRTRRTTTITTDRRRSRASLSTAAADVLMSMRNGDVNWHPHAPLEPVMIEDTNNAYNAAGDYDVTSLDPEGMKAYRQEAIRRHRAKINRLKQANPDAFERDYHESRRKAAAARTRHTGKFAREDSSTKTRATRRSTSSRR